MAGDNENPAASNLANGACEKTEGEVKRGGPAAPKVLSETTLIAAVSLVGYCSYFAYEASFLGHFGVPVDFVSVTLSGVIGKVAALLAASYFLIPALDWVSRRDFLHGRWMTVLFVVQEVTTLGLLLSFFAVGFLIGWPVLVIISVAGAVIHAWRVYWVPRSVYPEIIGWLKRIGQRQHDRVRRSTERGLVYALKLKFGRVPVAVALLGIVVVTFASLFGGWKAKGQTVFGTTIIGGAEYALIRKYDQQYIFLPLNRKQRMVADSALTLTAESVSRRGLVISFEPIGSLRSFSPRNPVLVTFPEEYREYGVESD
ncbi:MAG: hypothetical protein WC497_05975 [Patescibacteria group bacterium]